MILKLAPNTAALDTPRVDGEAIELDKVVCIINPDIDNPAPQIKHAKTLGNLIFKIIRLLTSLDKLNNPFIHSIKDIFELPTNKHTKLIIITNKNNINKINF